MLVAISYTDVYVVGKENENVAEMFSDVSVGNGAIPENELWVSLTSSVTEEPSMSSESAKSK